VLISPTLEATLELEGPLRFCVLSALLSFCLIYPLIRERPSCGKMRITVSAIKFPRILAIVDMANEWDGNVVLRSTKVKCEDGFELQHTGSYLLTIQYGHLSLTAWPQRTINRYSPKPMTSRSWVQGHKRSKVKVDLNSQGMGSYMSPIQIMALSLFCHSADSGHISYICYTVSNSS